MVFLPFQPHGNVIIFKQHRLLSVSVQSHADFHGKRSGTAAAQQTSAHVHVSPFPGEVQDIGTFPVRRQQNHTRAFRHVIVRILKIERTVRGRRNGIDVDQIGIIDEMGARRPVINNMHIPHIRRHQHVTERFIIRDNGKFSPFRGNRLVRAHKGAPCLFRKFRPLGITEIPIQTPAAHQPPIPGMGQGQRSVQEKVVFLPAQSRIPETQFIQSTLEPRLQHNPFPA